MPLPTELDLDAVPEDSPEPASFEPCPSSAIPGVARPALDRQPLCSASEGEEDDEDDFDDDFDDDFEDELDDELNDDLEDFDEDIEQEGAEIDGEDDEDAAFEEEDF